MSVTPRRAALRALLAASALAVPAVVLAPAGPASATAAPSFTKIQGAAGSAAGLQPTVDAYRALLGGADNGSTPGSQPDGRREINWDAVPDALSSPAVMPPDLFNSTVPRGAVFGPGPTQVSSSNPLRFSDINPQYDDVFSTFSPEKLFTPRGGTTTRVRFFSPGSHSRAYVHGFGAVFTDVDKAGSTSITLYDRWGHQLWKGSAPRATRADKGLSFLGVKTDAQVYEVKITSGDTPLSPWTRDGGGRDVVAIDDLVYSEPQV